MPPRSRGNPTPLPGDDDGTAAGDRLTSLPASITYSITHLGQPTRGRLTAVSLFHGVTDADVLGAFSQQPEAPARFRDTSAEDWAEGLDRAAAVGLLTPLGAGMYGIHPALPAYLAARWRTEDPDGYGQQRAAATSTLLDAHAAFGDWLTEQISSGDAALAYALIDRQRRTLGHLLGHALATAQWQQAQAIADPLNAYWNVRGLATEADAWVDRARLALETTDGTPPALDDPGGALWLFLVSAQASRQLRAGKLDAAERACLRILDMLTAQPDSTERQQKIINGGR
jgi:hypothetical protein